MNHAVAIVTGAGSGIGRATALRLAALGYRVGLVGRREALLHEVAAEIERAGGQALVLRADVAQVNDVQRLVRHVIEKWGRVDALVNNAGTVAQVPLAEMPLDRWHEMLEGNLSSALYTLQAVWPVMKSQFEAAQRNGEKPAVGGVIVNLSSMAARDPFPGLGAYAVAKIGVNMLTLVSAREGDAIGIRVVGIAPGAVDTPMFRGLVSGGGEGGNGQGKVDTEGVMRAEEVAETIAEVVAGAVRWTSGETLYLHRRPA